MCKSLICAKYFQYFRENFLVLTIATILVAAKDSPVVEISDGKIQGNLRTNRNGEEFHSFLGIPYGKAPVGDLRFKAPLPIDPWIGIKNATREGAKPFQRNEITNRIEGSEDCLNLNVYTKTLPSEENKLKPVMVFIYGGSFVRGSNTPLQYGPEYLLSEDIVLVVINYRVGFLGFLHLIDKSLDVPGNSGLKDQRLALKWVQKNIRNFNGNPDDVTIYGESAGAVSVHFQVLSPSTKGLFNKAIISSGSTLDTWAYSSDSALKFAQSIDQTIENETSALELLRKLPVEELYANQESFTAADPNFIVISPNIEYAHEDAIISEIPYDIITSGQCNQVPVIFGYNDQEGLLFKAMENRAAAAGLPPDNDVNLTSLIHTHMRIPPDDPRRMLIAEKYENFYFREDNVTNKYVFLGDLNFITGTIAAAKLHAKINSQPVYLYRMSLDAGLNVYKKLAKVTEKGAIHADDLGYVFNMPLAASILSKGPVEEKGISDFVKLWTNFVKYGDPTPKRNCLDSRWKPITKDQINFLDIGEELTLHTNPEPKRMAFWKSVFQLSPYTYNYL